VVDVEPARAKQQVLAAKVAWGNLQAICHAKK
jgi:hypothetical protein